MAVLPLTVLVPLVAAAGLAALRPIVPRLVSDVVAVGTAIAVVVLCAIVLARTGHGTTVYWFGGWRPSNGIALGISFAVDGLGAGLAAFVAVLTVAGLVYSWRHLESVGSLFHVLMLAFLAAMVGFSLTGDLFNMFVFFELLSVSAYALSGFRANARAPLQGSINFATTNTVGSIVVLLGISLIYGRTGALNLAQIGATLGHGPPDGLVVVAFALLVTGFFVKAAVIPFHFWLADAYSVAPTPVCILFAGAMSELGLYAVARIYWTVFHGTLGPHDAELRAILVAAGLLTALLGAVMCFAQHHLKRLLAFATMSYIGIFLVGIALLGSDALAGTATYIVGDGLVKASLFVCVGIVQHRRASIDEVALHGRCRDLRLLGLLFAIGGLAVATAPPFGPFFGKALIEDAVLKQGGYDWLPPFFVVVSALTGGAVLRAGAHVFLGVGSPGREDAASDDADRETESEAEEEEHRTPATMWIPAVGLMGAGLAWGLIPGLARSAGAAAARFVDQGSYVATVLYGRVPPPLHAPPTPGPSTSSYIYGAGSALAAVAVAVAALNVDRLPRWLSAGLLGGRGRMLAVLRAVHSGHPGDYVAWIAFGVAAFGGAFALGLR